jgi:Zn-dependent protease with chaperone function
MKQCQQCTTQVGDNYRICPKCGSSNFMATGSNVAGVQPPKPIPPVQPAQPQRKLLRPIMQVALLPRWTVAAIVGGVALFVVMMFAGSGWLADSVARNTPIDRERNLTEEFLASEDGLEIRAAALPDDSPSVQLVRRIGRDLLQAQANPAGFEYQFMVVQSDEINAFAMPGGLVVVFTGLLKIMKSPEQLAAVIAHEIQHVEHRHGLRGHYRSIGTAALVGMIFGVAQDMGTSITAALINLKHSRNFEVEADIEGAKLLARVGVSPKVMVEMLDKLGQHESGWSPNIINSHPSGEKRSHKVAAMPETQMNLPSRFPAWND